MGGGAFYAPRYFSAGAGPRGIGAADFDDYRLFYFAVAAPAVGNSDVTLVHNQGNNKFADLDYATGMGSAGSVATADLDGDVDVVVANFISGELKIILNQCVP